LGKNVKVLDVGCGQRKKAGALGIDSSPRSSADIIHDLDHFPWPLPDDEFDVIYCYHVLEHLDDIVRVMEELHRVGKKGAMVEIRTPHFSSLYSWQDPTHQHHFALDSFDYFTEGTRHTNFYTDKRFRVLQKQVEFGRSWISIVPRLLSMISPRLWEKHFAFMFPANDLLVQLEIMKE